MSVLPVAAPLMNEACFDARTLDNLAFSTSQSPCATPVLLDTLEDVELSHFFSL